MQDRGSEAIPIVRSATRKFVRIGNDRTNLLTHSIGNLKSDNTPRPAASQPLGRRVSASQSGKHHIARLTGAGRIVMKKQTDDVAGSE